MDQRLLFLFLRYTGGIWPCGIITLLAELFISESKSQVYGAVHDFIRCNPEATEDISKLLLVNKFTAGQYA